MLAVIPSLSGAAEIRIKGKLDVAPAAPLMVVSTDPVVQRILMEDFSAARRIAAGGATQPVTLTVTVNQRVLRPGVSLADLAPGDPDVLGLLKSAGAEAPALADTGSSPIDPYAAAAGIASRNPPDPAQQQLSRAARNSGMPGIFPDYNLKDFQPGTSAATSDLYPSAIIARATLSSHPSGLSVVAMLHPGEDARQVRQKIAEQIANAILH